MDRIRVSRGRMGKAWMHFQTTFNKGLMWTIRNGSSTCTVVHCWENRRINYCSNEKSSDRETLCLPVCSMSRHICWTKHHNQHLYINSSLECVPCHWEKLSLRIRKGNTVLWPYTVHLTQPWYKSVPSHLSYFCCWASLSKCTFT